MLPINEEVKTFSGQTTETMPADLLKGTTNGCPLYSEEMTKQTKQP